MDNGEQDGRYLSFTPGQYRGRGGDPSSRPSELRSAYLHFARFFDEDLESVPGDDEIDLMQTLAFHRVVQTAIDHTQSAEKEEVEISDLIVAIFSCKLFANKIECALHTVRFNINNFSLETTKF